MEYRGTVIVKKKTDDELMHFKYIKRKKTPKGWRYWYAKEPIGLQERSEMNSWEQKYNNVKERRDSVWPNADRAARSKYEESPSRHEIRYNTLIAELKPLKAKTTLYKNVYKAKIEKYYKTPIGRLEKSINKGREILNSIFKRK